MKITTLSFIYKIVIISTLLLASKSAFSQTSEVTIDVNWPTWAGENYFRIYNPAGTLIYDYCSPSNCYNGVNETHSASLNLGCLPNGTAYRVELYDRYGDGWNSNGSIVIKAGGVTTFTGTLPSGSSSDNPFTVSGGGVACNPAPQLNLFGNGVAINNNDTTPSTVDYTDLGSTTISTNLSRTFDIINNGGATLNLTGTPRVQITGANAADFTISTQPIASIASGGNSSFTLRFNRATVGTSNAIITIASNDPTNPSYSYSVRAAATSPVSVPITQTVYYENFDSGANGWTSSISGTFKWTLGRNGEKGEGNYWYTDTYNNYVKNKIVQLTSPRISTVGYSNATFYLDFRTETEIEDDGMRIEYSANDGLTWNVLGSNTTGTNWYTSNDVDGIANNAHGWTGNNSSLGSALSRFEEASHVLPAVLDNNALVRFRITFGSDNDDTIGDGVMVDNIIITGVTNSTPVISEGPADVKSNLTLWLESKTIGLTNGTTLTTWNDRAINNNAAEIVSNAPIFSDNPVDNVNFNAAVTFNRASQQHMRGKGGYNSNDYWVVVRSKLDVSNTGSNETMILGAKAAQVSPTKDPSGIGWGPVSARYTNEVLAHNIGTVSENDPSDGSYGRAFTDPSRTFDDVAIINVKNNPLNNQTNIYLNGRKLDNATGITTISGQQLNFAEFNNKPFYIGVGRYTLNGEPFESHLDGQITEIVSFSSRQDDAVQQKIYSYLAIKNGVSLQSPTTPLSENDHRATWDYLDSDNNVIWSAVANNTYNYDVAAIGRDDKSQLVQRQSKSENDTSILAIGVNRVEDIGSQNTTSFNADKDFLTWGHNGLNLNQHPTPVTISLGASNAIALSIDKINRIWKVQDRAASSIPRTQVRIETAHFSGLGTLASNERYVMIIADDASFTTNVETSVFTNDGIYERTRYNFKGIKYITLGKTVVIDADRSTAFDGVNDFLEITDGAGLGSRFSASAWIKSEGPNSTNTNRAIVAKRNGISGFELYLDTANRAVVYWYNGSAQTLVSNTAIAAGNWRYITTSFDGSLMKLYIDGVLDSQIAMSAPSADSNILTIGARKENDGNVLNPFNGEIDEVRMWDVALSQDQIRFIMNQELVENTNIVQGNVIPTNVTKNEMATINWDQLAAYYSMNTFIGTSLNDESVNEGYGNLANADYYDLRTQTAPLPYVSSNNGNWEDTANWVNGTIQFAPASTRLINGTIHDIQWNIVKTSHDVAITTKDVALLGLFVENNQLDVTNDHGLTITHYLELDGIIDLKGEAQLIQTTGSDLNPTSAGYIERDQQGTFDKYNYNYWSSPVGISNTTTNNNDFNIVTVLKDGTYENNPRTLNFTNMSIGDGAAGTSTTAATISGRWLYKYGNQTSGQYSNWQYLGESGMLKAGEGWTMKGTGTASSDQNYVFTGKPNNGDINLTINAGNDYLVGNPYPSALDTHEFLMDNPEINGTVYFWEHWGGNSHQLQQYQGGYAMYNLSGGLGNATYGTSHPSVNQGGIATKQPGRFVAVAQGFFVTGISNGSIKFRNDQRQFVKETSTNSVFVSAPGSTAQTNVFSDYNTVNDLRTKFRIGFDSPGVIHRQLLLTIDPNASAGYDRLFDGELYDEQFDDMSFRLANKNLAIQGIPATDAQVELPLKVKLSNPGSIVIKLDDIHNVDPTQEIFLKDALQNTFTNLMTDTYTSEYLWAGIYNNRFSIVFANPSTLSTNDVVLNQDDLIVFTPQGMQTLNVKKAVDLKIDRLSLTNMLGQQVQTWDVSSQDGIITVPTSGIATGNYIVTMHTDYGIVTRKIILN